MPLPLPILDDRRWADLVEEGRALVPRYAPGWTDHNAHDPGITLIELFAWLAEMIIYRLNQVPERHRRKFLALVGCVPYPPRPARTMLSFSPPAGAQPFSLPAGVIFETVEPADQPVQFQTLSAISIVAAQLAAVQVDRGDGSDLLDCWRSYQAGLPFNSFGADPRPGAMLYLGFAAALPPASDLAQGYPVSLGLRFAGETTGADERTRLIDEAQAHAKASRPPRPAIICVGQHAVQDALPQPGLPVHHGARTVWEYFAAGGRGRWVTLKPDSEVSDDTRAFTLEGSIRLALPSAMALKQVGEGGQELYYLRCRLADGSRYDAAPQLAGISLNAVEAEQAAPARQLFTLAANATISGPPPTLGAPICLTLRLDAAGVITALTFLPKGQAASCPQVRVLAFKQPAAGKAGSLEIELVWLGQGTGAPGQQLSLPHAPVLAERVALYSLEQRDNQLAWRAWAPRQDLDASGRADCHYLLDPTAGEVVFGDGERGRVPPAGALLFATYATTHAASGNVRDGSVSHCADRPENRCLLTASHRALLSQISSNRAQASGGAAAESLAHATGRAVEALWAHERLQSVCEHYGCQTLDQLPASTVHTLPVPVRAVNTLDIERLALSVPGTAVARARAWANHYPDIPCVNAVGVVTLVIVPTLPLKRPQPSGGLCRMVRCYLERRRIVTTRIIVVGPEYLEVQVQASVRRRQGVDPARLKATIVKALDEFLDPLHGGPGGYGWPFGRNVYRSEILQLIDNLPGVDYVRALTLIGDRGSPQCGNLCLSPTWLVTPGQHQVEIL